jgi:hypothetical protein
MPSTSLELRARDYERDAVGESDDDGARDEANGGPAAGEAHDGEHDTGHHRAHEEPIEPVLRNDARDHHDEGARWSADFYV